MHTILTLFRKDLLGFSKDKVAVGLTFVVPIVLIYIFGNVFGVTRGSSGPSGIPLAIVNESAAPEVATLVAALKKEKTFRVVESTPAAEKGGAPVVLTEPIVREGFRANRYRFALVFPANATTDSTVGLQFKFLFNPRNDIETQMVTGILQKTIYTEIPTVMMSSLRQQAVEAVGGERTDRFYDSMAGAVSSAFGYDRDRVRAAMQKGDFLSTIPAAKGSANGGGAAGFLDRVIRMESEQLAGGQVKNVGATRAVGGWAVMFLLFALSGVATSLFDEKKAGLFQRLLSGPVTRSQILWSKYLFGIALGLVQLVVLFFAGRLMFGIDVTSNFGNLIVICLATAIACTAFGMLLAAITRTAAAAQGLATLLVLTMSAIGGAWFPTSLMPEFIQQLSKLSVVYWSMEGFAVVLWNDGSILDLLPVLTVLLGIAGLLVSISLWRFRRGPVFD